MSLPLSWVHDFPFLSFGRLMASGYKSFLSPQPDSLLQFFHLLLPLVIKIPSISPACWFLCGEPLRGNGATCQSTGKNIIRDFSLICRKQKCALTKLGFYFTEQALIQHDKIHVVYQITGISHSDKGMFAMCHKHTQQKD